MHRGDRDRSGERGFSMTELSVAIGIILIIFGMAIAAFQPAIQAAKYDTGMRQVLDQLRQAREYSLANRRYVQVSFPIVPTAEGPQYEVVITELNSLTAGGGAVNPVLSTTPIQFPEQFYVYPGYVDTPDAYGNSGAIVFGGTIGGPAAGMLFQSDGELVSAATLQPINGTVFLGVPGNPQSVRAITVLGSTGRVRGWKGADSRWFAF
jgi:prepilin-type N-terminal cleavage/methylation domain-containing protein